MYRHCKSLAKHVCPSLMLRNVKHHLTIMSNCAWFVQTKPSPHPHLTVIHSLYLRQTPSLHQAENKTAKDEMSMNPHIIRPDSSAHTSAALRRSVMAWQPEICLWDQKQQSCKNRLCQWKLAVTKGEKWKHFTTAVYAKHNVACLLCTLICSQHPQQWKKQTTRHKMIAKIHGD